MSAPTSPAGSPTVSPRAHSSKSSPTPPELLPRGLRPTSAASRADEKPLMGNAYYAPMPSWGFSTLVPAPQRATANQSHEAEEAAGEAVMAAGEAAMSQQTINQVEAPKKNVPADCRGNKTHGNETAKWGLEGTFLAAEGQRAAHARLSDGVLSENSAAAGLAGGAAQRKASLSSFTARGHLKVGKPFSTRAPAAAKSAATKSAAGTEPASTKSTTTRGGTQSERLGFMSWMRGVRLADADAKDAAAATALICTYPLPDTEQEDWEVVPSGADTGNDDWEQVVVDREPAEGDLVFA